MYSPWRTTRTSMPPPLPSWASAAAAPTPWPAVPRSPRTRLLAAGIIAGLYPPSLGLKGMLLEPRVMLWVAQWAPGFVEMLLGWSMGAAAATDDGGVKLEKLVDDAMKSRPGPDKQVWEENVGGFRPSFVASVKGAVGGESGTKGAAYEARLLGGSWGFELADIAMEKGKMVMWHGTADGNVPVLMATKAHKLLPGSELRIVEGEAHLSLAVRKAEEIFDVLKERATG